MQVRANKKRETLRTHSKTQLITLERSQKELLEEGIAKAVIRDAGCTYIRGNEEDGRQESTLCH